MNRTSLYQLAYLSSALAKPSETGLRAILETSRRNNGADGITGLLLYHDGNFFQVLEGAKGAVLTCYDRIVADSRHHGHIVLLSEEISQRNFSDWSMAYVPYAELTVERRKGLRDLQALRDDKALRTAVKDAEVGVFVNGFLANFRL
jgi:Sensors of blue-light using FAD